MNKVIFKNIDSSTIEGLIICELPCITKPKQRFNEIIVNGVDGSIIEELGYDSYDKVLKIGILKNADIDTIIKFFSGSGNIIFSNESDKIYKATILNQINYDRLLKYKIADVIIKVQPFKYKVDEGISTFLIPGIINNYGLEKSKPYIKLYGNGFVEIKVNDIAVFNYTFPTKETEVIIDSEIQDAYLNDVLKNRNMSGEFPELFPGKNNLSWSGNIDKIEILARSRWI